MPGKRSGAKPRPSKYQPLTDYLVTQHAESVRLSLAQIEGILGFPLPNPAHVIGPVLRKLS